jgi:hypothetical protein
LFPHHFGFHELLTQEGLAPHFMGREVDGLEEDNKYYKE